MNFNPKMKKNIRGRQNGKKIIWGRYAKQDIFCPNHQLITTVRVLLFLKNQVKQGYTMDLFWQKIMAKLHLLILKIAISNKIWLQKLTSWEFQKSLYKLCYLFKIRSNINSMTWMVIQWINFDNSNWENISFQLSKIDVF